MTFPLFTKLTYFQVHHKLFAQLTTLIRAFSLAVMEELRPVLGTLWMVYSTEWQLAIISHLCYFCRAKLQKEQIFMRSWNPCTHIYATMP